MRSDLFFSILSLTCDDVALREGVANWVISLVGLGRGHNKHSPSLLSHRALHA